MANEQHQVVDGQLTIYDVLAAVRAGDPDGRLDPWCVGEDRPVVGEGFSTRSVSVSAAAPGEGAVDGGGV